MRRKIANNKKYGKIQIKSRREHISNIGFNESLLYEILPYVFEVLLSDNS